MQALLVCSYTNNWEQENTIYSKFNTQIKENANHVSLMPHADSYLHLELTLVNNLSQFILVSVLLLIKNIPRLVVQATRAFLSRLFESSTIYSWGNLHQRQLLRHFSFLPYAFLILRPQAKLFQNMRASLRLPTKRLSSSILFFPLNLAAKERGGWWEGRRWDCL